MADNATRDITAFLRQRVVPPGGSRHGLVVGIEQYRDARLNLRCAAADAKAIFDLMTDPDCGMFPKDNVTLLLDSEATKAAIWSALASLRRKVGKHDTVWVYYAGHGAAEGSDYYWVPFDGDVDDLYATGISRDNISDALARLAAERVVTFLDCCYAAATAAKANPTRVTLTAEELLQAYKGKGRVILSASDGREKSIELSDHGHGAFTWFLTQGLRGNADVDGNGIVHLDGLWSYLQDRVTDASRMAGNQQSPVLLGEHSHKLALTLNPLVTERKRAIAVRLRELVGLEEADLSTEEARLCMKILRDGPRNQAERDVSAEFDSLMDNQVRMSTFKRLIQGAVSCLQQGVSESPPLQVPLAPPVVASPDDALPCQSVETLRRRFALADDRAVSLIDAWSLENPRYLNPLSAHAEMVACENSELYTIAITALCESRTSSVEHEPFDGDPEAVQCAQPIDKWAVPCDVPRHFEERTDSWQNPVPKRIITCDECGGKGQRVCTECHGTGEWVCSDCQGSGKVMCRECSGTGKDHRRYSHSGPKIGDGTFSEKDKCRKCHGATTLPCTACKGQPKRTCPVCSGQKSLPCEKCASAGRLAEHDIVEVAFSVQTATKRLSASGTPFGDQRNIQKTEIAPVLSWVTEKKQLPDALAQLPTDLAQHVRQYWNATVPTLKGKVHRVKLDVGFIPSVTCRMKHEGIVFDVQIIGQERTVLPSAGVPEDKVYIRQKRIEELQGKVLECTERLSKVRAIVIGFCVSLVLVVPATVLGILATIAHSQPDGPVLLLSIIPGSLVLLTLIGLLSSLFGWNVPCDDGLIALRARLRRLSAELALLQRGSNSEGERDA